MKMNRKKNKFRLKPRKGWQGTTSDYRLKTTEYKFLFLCLGSCVLGLVSLTGCDSAKKIESLNQQITQLSEEKEALAKQIDDISSENKELTKQNQTLSELPENVKGKNLYQLANVKIHGFSGFSDEDEDGEKDTLVVYIQPIDENGDKFKAPGAVEVELWNLNNSEDQALLHRWSVEFEDLKEKWVALLVTNYRLTFDITKIVENFDEPLNLKIKFTDYLSGKVFYNQKVIKPE